MARSIKEVHTINYYPINEGAARRAKEMNSFSDYKEGSATAEYRAMVDKAAAIAEQQKSRVDPMYHEKIDHLLDTYARKLAENMNQGFAIDARVQMCIRDRSWTLSATAASSTLPLCFWEVFTLFFGC